MIFCCFVFFAPNALGDPDNYIPANPMADAADIVPEWYFLPFYAILRSVPDIPVHLHRQSSQASSACSAPSLLFFLPWLDSSPVRSARFRPMYKWAFWVLVIGCDRARHGRRASSRGLVRE